MRMNNEDCKMEALDRVLDALSRTVLRFNEGETAKYDAAFQEIFLGGFVHEPSRVFFRLCEIHRSSDRSTDTLAENLRLFCADREAQKSRYAADLRKLADFVSLETAHLGYLDASAELRERQAAAMIGKAGAAAEAADRVREKMGRFQRESVAAVGIVAAILAAFFAGIGWSASVLENIEKATVYRLSGMTLLLAVGLFNLLALLMSFIRSMTGRENTITGDLRVSTFGGGTCNTEFEFLTGCTLGFFPTGSVVYQQYIRQATPSLVTLLQQQGYTAYAVHPFYNYCWNRNKVYPLLGFEHFYDLSDFPGAKMLGSYVSNCVSDESDFEKLIELFEEKDPGEPLFLFNVTMQNHGGYSKLLNAPDELVHMSKGDYTSQYADNYLSLIRATDAAFEDLISYFEQVEEPTIILLFGDHAPNLPDGVYEALMGKDLDDLTLEETQQRYTTPFVLWANYDIETGTGDAGTISANYLSTLLLRTAGLETSAYMDFLDQLSRQIPAINLNGYLGADGTEYSYEDDSEYLDLIEEYRSLQYNYLFDKEDRLDSLFTPR